jgi:hypothetical protein
VVLPPCRKFGASLSIITKRSLSVPSGVSWIVKAGEVLPQALIPAHEKLALKAEAACIEVNRNTAANPKALGNTQKRANHLCGFFGEGIPAAAGGLYCV